MHEQVEVGDDAIAIMSGPDFLNGRVCSASEPCPVSLQSKPATGFVFRRVFIRGRSVAIGSEEYTLPDLSPSTMQLPQIDRCAKTGTERETGRVVNGTEK